MAVLRRMGILEAFLLFVTALFVADAVIGYRAFVSAGERASGETLSQASDTVLAAIEHLQSDAESLILRFADGGDPLRVDSLQPREANAFLMWYMRTHPEITSVNYGDSMGNGYMILSHEGRWRTRVRRAGNAGSVTWADLDGQGRPVSLEDRHDDYDPRVRPWFVAAADTPGISWSPPYVFRTTREPGITASARIDHGDGDIVRVVGVDILLSDVSRLLSGLNRETPDLEVWLISDGGQVLASSDQEVFLPYLNRESPVLPSLAEPGFQGLSAAVEALGLVDTSGPAVREFESGGRMFYGWAEPLIASGDPGLWVVTMVPRVSLPAYFESAGRLKISLFLLFAVLSGLFFVLRYVLPLRRLSSSLRTFGTAGYVSPPSTTRTDEVGVLATELSRLADDLAERRRELAESEARYRDLFEAVQDGVFETGADGRFVRANTAMAEIFGVPSAGDLIGRPVVDFWEDPGERELFLAELESRKSVGSYRSHSRKEDGTAIVVEVSAVRLEGEAGEFLGTEGIMRDVTAAAASAEAMRQAADEWRTTFDSMSDLVSVHDREHRIVSANAAMGEFFEMEPERLVGMRCHELFHGPGGPCPDCPFPEAERTLQPVSRETDEPRLGVPLQITASPIVNPEGDLLGCVHVARDLTERRKLEGQLRQSQKMEAIGRLAGGVAHDFNNMLSVIIGFTEEALVKIGGHGPAAEDLRQVRSAADRSANLTRQLLAFSRRQPIEPKVVDLNERLLSMEGMVRRLLGEDVRVRLELAPQLWPVEVDPSQMDQAVANLVANARDAMPDGGTLLVETGNVTIREGDADADGAVPPGDYVMLVVSDDGEGMDRETLLHAFEPFFTTKAEGRGTGLGLATVYGTIRQNGGHVLVDSAPGFGTTVSVYLPRREGPEIPQSALGHPTAGRKGAETVLLVEDEEQVRRLARTVLERLGYRVFEAPGPEEALALAEANGHLFDLVLSDVVMPGMNGRELVTRLRTRLPEVDVLFMSGYAADVVAGRVVLDDGADFLEKPFTPDELGRKVREVLDRN